MRNSAHPIAAGNVAGNLLAGITVALVLVPQSIAYATLAGLSPVHGLYAAAVAPIAAALLASSPYLQTGPVAMTSLLTFGALSAIAAPFSATYVAYAALLALVVGVARVALGLLRAGAITYLMSDPIVLGFTTAAALLIIGSQMPPLLGLATPQSAVGYVRILGDPSAWSLSAILIGALTLVCIYGGRRLHAIFPGVLVAVVMGIVWSRATGYAGPVIGTVPQGLPQPTFDLPWLQLPQLLVPGLIIAVVGFAEPAAIARTIAAQTRQRWNADRELVSQGVANIAAGLVSAFPVGGSFSRTQINRGAGGNNQLSSLVAGMAIIAFLPYANLLATLPLAVLAAIVISAVLNLVRVDALSRLVGVSRAQAGVAWCTFGLTLMLAPRIDLAILNGIGISIAVHLWRERRVSVAVSYDNGQLRLEPVGVLFFGSAAALNDALLTALADHKGAERLIFDLRRVGRIDYTGAVVIERLAADAASAGLAVHILPGGKPQGGRLMKRILGEGSPWLAPPPVVDLPPRGHDQDGETDR